MATLEISNTNIDLEKGDLGSDTSINIYLPGSEKADVVNYRVTLFGKPIWYFVAGLFCVFAFSLLLTFLLK
jgi:hypothetical protein